MSKGINTPKGNKKSKFENMDYQNFLKKFFNATFPHKLIDYILDLSAKEIAISLSKQIKKSLLAIEHPNRFTVSEQRANIVIHNIKEIPNKKLRIDDIDCFLKNIPALIPLTIMLLKTHNYLNKLSARYSFIDSITIKINKKDLLNELFDKNLCSGGFINEKLKNLFPIIEQYFYMIPQISENYRIFNYLYYIIDKAIYQPVEKLEDRLFMDMNTLLDVYCFSQDDPFEYNFCHGIADVPNVDDKVSYILYSNVVMPEKEQKKKEELKNYIDAYKDYNLYKYWFNKIKFLVKYANNNICYQNIIKDLQSLNIGITEMHDYSKAIESIYKCPLGLSEDNCSYKSGKSCLQSAYDKERSVANYIYKTNENVYRILTTLFNASSDENLYNLFEKSNIKNLCLAVIKSKYNYLSDKNDKTISNIFANYNEILKQYSAKTEDDNIQYLSHTRYDALDDKEYEEETLEDKIIENLYILYLNFVNYVEKPNDKQKIQILNIIEKLDKLVSKK